MFHTADFAIPPLVNVGVVACVVAYLFYTQVYSRIVAETIRVRVLSKRVVWSDGGSYSCYVDTASGTAEVSKRHYDSVDVGKSYEVTGHETDFGSSDVAQKVKLWAMWFSGDKYGLLRTRGPWTYVPGAGQEIVEATVVGVDVGVDAAPSVLKAMCCVIAADGQISKREKLRVVCAFATLRAPMHSDEIVKYLKTFVSRVRSLGYKSVLNEAVEELAAVAHKISDKEAVFREFQRAVEVDGEIDERERTVLERFRAALTREKPAAAPAETEASDPFGLASIDEDQTDDTPSRQPSAAVPPKKNANANISEETPTALRNMIRGLRFKVVSLPQCFIKRGEQVLGPFSSSQFIELMEANEITLFDLIARYESGPFRALKDGWPIELHKPKSKITVVFAIVFTVVNFGFYLSMFGGNLTFAFGSSVLIALCGGGLYYYPNFGHRIFPTLQNGHPAGLLFFMTLASVLGWSVENGAVHGVQKIELTCLTVFIFLGGGFLQFIGIKPSGGPSG